MFRKSKNGWLLSIKLITLSLAFTVTIMLIIALNHIADVYVVKKYRWHIGECWSSLTLQSDKSFIYNDYSGSFVPGITMRGIWNKSNDTLELNGRKEIVFYENNMRDTFFFNKVIFNHARFKVYHDSIIHLSGESSHIHSMETVDY